MTAATLSAPQATGYNARRARPAVAIVPDLPAEPAGPARDVRAPATNKRGRYVPTGEYISAARRFVRGAGKRVGTMDIDELAALRGLAEEADAVMHAAAVRLHDECDYSYADIGRALGITKQSAHRMLTVWAEKAAAAAGKDPS